MDPSSDRRAHAGVSRPKLVAWVVAFGVGAYLGYGIAYSLSLSGLGSLGAVVAVLIAAIILTILAAIAILAALMPDKRGRPTARAATVAGIMLVFGAGTGWAVTSALQLGYRAPVMLEAEGVMSLSLDGIDGYAGLGAAPAICHAEMDGERVASVEANLVGNVGTGMVGASVLLLPDSPDGRPEVQVAITPADKTVDAAPSWRGPAAAVEPTEGARAGRIIFNDAPLTAADEGGPPPDGWPAGLSGTVTWSCRDWLGPGASPEP